jgi:hypothetical protein
MIAMQRTRPDSLRPLGPEAAAVAIEQVGERAGIPTADRPATATAPFQPLDSSIVNEAIPAFFIGRNREGFWVARDVRGRIGGIFLFESSALAFARRNSRPAGCATIYPSERFELDLENRGNPLIERLSRGMRLARGLRRQAVVLMGSTAEAVKSWRNDLQLL